MPEYSYGIWHNWELSFQLPVAVDENRLRTNGYRGELQYVAPHDDERGPYWGFNLEVANQVRTGEERAWNVELVPIVGLRIERWHLVANPGLSKILSGPRRKLAFEPALKAAYKVAGKNYFGVEYYVDAGPLRRLLPNGQQSQMLYLAWDGKVGKSDINVGIGRGLTNVSDPWVLKAVVEFGF